MTFDIFLTNCHLFDILTSFNLNHLSPSQGYFSFSLLDTICIELALAITSASQTRYELLGLIAAGEYTPLNSFIFQLCGLIAGGSELFV